MDAFKDLSEQSPRQLTDLGKEVHRTLDTIVGLGPWVNELPRQFIVQLGYRGLPGMTVFRAYLGSVVTGRRIFWVVQRTIGLGAYLTTAVRIEAISLQDGQIEIRHFERNWAAKAGRAGVRAVSLYGGFVLWAGAVLSGGELGRRTAGVGSNLMRDGLHGTTQDELVGFQNQESAGQFEMVLAALREAIDRLTITGDAPPQAPDEQATTKRKTYEQQTSRVEPGPNAGGSGRAAPRPQPSAGQKRRVCPNCSFIIHEVRADCPKCHTPLP